MLIYAEMLKQAHLFAPYGHDFTTFEKNCYCQKDEKLGSKWQTLPELYTEPKNGKSFCNFMK